MTYSCDECGEWVHSKRWALGYRLCLACGEAAARKTRATWTVVPLHKGHFTRIDNPEDLKSLNPKPK